MECAAGETIVLHVGPATSQMPPDSRSLKMDDDHGRARSARVPDAAAGRLQFHPPVIVGNGSGYASNFISISLSMFVGAKAVVGVPRSEFKTISTDLVKRGRQ